MWDVDLAHLRSWTALSTGTWWTWTQRVGRGCEEQSRRSSLPGDLHPEGSPGKATPFPLYSELENHTASLTWYSFTNIQACLATWEGKVVGVFEDIYIYINIIYYIYTYGYMHILLHLQLLRNAMGVCCICMCGCLYMYLSQYPIFAQWFYGLLIIMIVFLEQLLYPVYCFKAFITFAHSEYCSTWGSSTHST